MARNEESTIQAGIVTYLRTVVPQSKVFAVPNGGLRSKREAALLKWTGVLAGMFDLVMIVPGGLVYLFEVKTRTGSLSPEQRALRDWFISNNVPWAVVQSIDDARNALAAWAISTKEAA